METLRYAEHSEGSHEHALRIKPGSMLVQQRLHRFDEENHRVIGEEITKLLVAGFIKEVYHPKWLANPVLVKKKNGKWRMCVDYTSLNNSRVLRICFLYHA
jgi:hypothetical protein